MIYLVGGASRSGKSTLARKLLAENGIPYFPIDALMMGFSDGYPEFGLDPDASSAARGEKLWPILRGICVNLLEEARTHPAYLLEGDELLPGHVAELARDHGAAVKCCFLGYADASPERKLREVREREADWYRFFPDDEVLAFLAEQVEYSRHLREECAERGLAYFDGSADFSGAVEAACRYLTSD